jgi:hypothetical protein
VLIAPAREGCNELRILSGYASASFALYHLLELKEQLKLDVGVQLNIGMAGESGIALSEHQALRAAVEALGGGWLTVRYSPSGRSDHTKAYAWSDSNVPSRAWIGSSNYSQSGFGMVGTRRETLVSTDPYATTELIERATDGFVSIDDPFVFDKVSIYELLSQEVRERVAAASTSPTIRPPQGAPSVRLPLVQRTRNPGEVHESGGLNWGNRPGRNSSQAYIPVPAEVARSGFFPPRSFPFIAHTSEGDVLFFTIAQDGDKALHSVPDNAAVGLWFRRRLGVAAGAFVTTESLERYGAKHVTFSRLDDGNYFMDFRPSSATDGWKSSPLN